MISLGLMSPVWAADFNVEQIRIEGEQHTSEATVRSLLPIKEGERYTDAKGEQIIQKLHASGFYENVLLEEHGNMLIITVQERPIISSLNVKGAKVISNDMILKQMSSMRGAGISSDADLVVGQRVGEAGRSQEERLSEFTNRYDTAGALATTGLATGDFFSQEALVRALRALDQAYKEQGKNNVKITPEVQPLARNRVAITINVDEGETTRVKKINFVGNEAFSDYRLSRQINLTDGTLFSWLSKSNVFAWEKFAADKKRLETFYRDKGYFDFRVDLEDVERQLSEDKTREEVTIKVYEGEKYYWGDINLVGNFKDLNQEQLYQPLKKLKKGKLSNRDDLELRLAEVRLQLQSAGYANAQVSYEAARRIDEQGRHIMDINALVALGNRVAVRHITISGNSKTRDEVIRRELRQMEAAAYDQSKINRSEQRLRQLGYFEDVQIQRQAVPEDEQQTDLAISVKERSTGSLNASAGWSQDDGLILSGSVAQENLFGTGKSVSLSIMRSKVRQGANISFTDPYFTPDGVSMTYSLFGNQYSPYKLDANPRNYGLNRYGGSVTMGIPFTEYDRVNFGLGVEHMGVKLFDSAPYRYQRFVEQNGDKNWIYKGMVSWYRNTTDDSYWPTRGYQANITGEVALPGSGIQYYQLGHQQTWYFPLSKHFTLMLNGQIGYSGSYGKTKDVPFMFNQTGGGLGSVRGYESGSLGPKVYDTNSAGGARETESYGGKYAVNANAELLFPFPGIKDSRSVRLSLFADAGSVWDGKTYNSRSYGLNNPYGANGYYGTADHKSSFKNELRYSAGAALTWISPVGPIKLSYAYPLKKQNNDLIQRFQFSLGTVF